MKGLRQIRTVYSPDRHRSAEEAGLNSDSHGFSLWPSLPRNLLERVLTYQFRLFWLLVLATLLCLSWGQKGVSQAQFYSVQRETLAQKLRRLLNKADLSNPLSSDCLMGWQAWGSGVQYSVGTIVSLNSNCYRASGSNGVSGATGPAGKGVGQTDGGMTWDYVGPQTSPQISNLTTSTLPPYLSYSLQTIGYSNPLIRILGTKQPLDNGPGTNYSVYQTSCGYGGSGNTVNGSIAGLPPTLGFNSTHWGLQICTDAPVISFVTTNSGYNANFIIEEGGSKRAVSPVPVAIGSTGHTNAWTLDFTQCQHVNSINGSQACPGTGATAFATLTGGTVTAVTPGAAGVGYSQANLPSVILYGGGLTIPAQVIPVIGSSGSITSYTVVQGGAFQTTPSVAIVSGRQRRTITMVTGGSMKPANVYVGYFDTVWPVPRENAVKVNWLGDSWVEDFVAEDQSEHWGMSEDSAALLGADNSMASGEGGCGWTVPGTPLTATVTSGAFVSGTQTVTLSTLTATNGGARAYTIPVGTVLTFGPGTASSESQVVTSVDAVAKTVTCKFVNSHPGDETVLGYSPYNKCSTLVTSGAITGSALAQTVTIATTLTPIQTAGLNSGSKVIFDPYSISAETVQLTGLAGNSITGVVKNNHAANCVVEDASQVFNVSFGQRLSDVAYQSYATFSNKVGDAGNGVCSSIGLGAEGSGIVEGPYTFTATSSTAFSAVDGSGKYLPPLSVGTTYSHGGVTFTITPGSVPYSPGDAFIIYVVKQPDIIGFLPAGINDASAGAGTAVVQAEIQRAYSYIRSVLPTTPIVWFGCQGIVTTASQAVEQGYANVLASAMLTDPNLLYCPVQYDTPAWFSSQAWGNYYQNPANGHPTKQGFLYLGQRIIDCLRAWVQNATWP